MTERNEIEITDTDKLIDEAYELGWNHLKDDLRRSIESYYKYIDMKYVRDNGLHYKFFKLLFEKYI